MTWAQEAQSSEQALAAHFDSGAVTLYRRPGIGAALTQTWGALVELAGAHSTSESTIDLRTSGASGQTRSIAIDSAGHVADLNAAGVAGLSMRFYQNGVAISDPGVSIVNGTDPSHGWVSGLPNVPGNAYAMTYAVGGNGVVEHWPNDVYHASRVIPDRRTGLVVGDFAFVLSADGAEVADSLAVSEGVSGLGDWIVTGWPSTAGAWALHGELLISGGRYDLIHQWEIGSSGPRTTSAQRLSDDADPLMGFLASGTTVTISGTAYTTTAAVQAIGGQLSSVPVTPVLAADYADGVAAVLAGQSFTWNNTSVGLIDEVIAADRGLSVGYSVSLPKLSTVASGVRPRTDDLATFTWGGVARTYIVDQVTEDDGAWLLTVGSRT